MPWSRRRAWDALDAALARINEYQWLAFASINAIRYFFARLQEKGMDSRDLKGPKVAAVGIATAEALREYGIRADLIPEEYTGDGLAASMVAQGVKGAKVLIPRAKKAREILPDTLRANGAEVDLVTVYQNVRPKDYEMVREEPGQGRYRYGDLYQFFHGHQFSRNARYGSGETALRG